MLRVLRVLLPERRQHPGHPHRFRHGHQFMMDHRWMHELGRLPHTPRFGSWIFNHKASIHGTTPRRRLPQYHSFRANQSESFGMLDLVRPSSGKNQLGQIMNSGHTADLAIV